MIRVLQKIHGKIKEVDLKNAKNLSCINCSNLSLKELHYISDHMHIPLFEIKHVLDPQERPRLGIKKDYTVIIFNAVNPFGKDKFVFPIEIIVSKKYLIVLVAEKHAAVDKVFDEIDYAFWKKIEENGFALVVHKLLMTMIRDFFILLESIDDDLDFYEDEALEAREKHLHSLFILKRKLLYIRKSLVANREVVDILLESNYESFQVPRYLFQDVHIELVQAVSMEDMSRERLTSVLDIYLSAVSNKLNETMKSFTVIASLLLLPLLISGIYGMNIELPIADSPYAIWIITGIMIISIITTFIYFYRKGWV